MKEKFEILRAIAQSENWKAQHEVFGCHLSKFPNVEYLNETAEKMIEKCEIWAQNWKIIKEGIEPELKILEAARMDELVEQFSNFNKEQIEALVEALNRKLSKKDYDISICGEIVFK